jgi:hypothetical protein
MGENTRQSHKAEKAFRFNFLVLTYLMTQLDENGMGRFIVEFDAKRIVAIRRVSEGEPTINLVDLGVLTK